MKTDYDNISEAKHSLKENIHFMETLLTHLKGHNKILRGRATWAAWCIHRYFNDNLIRDIENAIKNNTPPSGTVMN